MNTFDDVTMETLEAFKKALTSGWTSATNVTGIDLTGLVSLTPRVTPTRDVLSRVASPNGAKFTQWEALLNVTNSQPSIFPGFDNAGGLIEIDEQTVQSNYAAIALSGLVTQDSMDIAKGYADAEASMVQNLMTSLLVLEDRALATGAQNYALPAITAPTGTSAATGGSIAGGTAVYVAVQARSGLNYFSGGSGIASAATNVVTTATGTATNAVTSKVAAVRGAVAYDWFVGSSTTVFYLTTTTVNQVVIKAIPTANQALPTNELPDLFGTAPTAPATADTSFSANCFNSILALLAGDYSSAGSIITNGGSGTPSGAIFTSLDGATMTLSGSSLTALDSFLLQIYNNIKCSPKALMMNAQQASDISSLLLGTYLAPTFLQPTPEGRSNIAGGGYIGSYINKAVDGQPISLEVHPGVPPGTIIARTDSLPSVPSSNIGNVFEVRTLRDYAQFAYAANRVPASGPSGPRSELEVRSVETVVCKAPVACGVLSNIANAE